MISESVKQAIDNNENAICRFEATVFGEGAFSIGKINESLNAVKLNELVKKESQRYIDMGLIKRPSSTAPSLSQKKDYFMNSFDEFNGFITPIIDNLKTALCCFPDNERIQKLLERSDKCVKELDNLRTVVRNFN
jgi:hypothetical protein